MLKHALLLLLLFLLSFTCFPQQKDLYSCGEKQAMQDFYKKYPHYKAVNDQIEKVLAKRNRDIKRGLLKPQVPAVAVILPVVVHIIHNNGPENISDAQVFAGIQHLNEAFANSGYYDPANGVNTQIQFCMAQRDPFNNPTNGITRNVSSYTNMGGANFSSDDQNVKNINRWDPNCYINIWLVNSIPTTVVGYAYLPSAHGTSLDGIIEEAAYFGSSNVNDVVITHEMGHYLGLYHTFEGACTNNDCITDGDRVCDTPPDQSTAGISCGSSVNSCTTDALSGFSTDQPDITQDYMDYGNLSCMKVFTQGQADRMNYFIQNVRQSLLHCKSCMTPCPAPVVADFNTPAAPLKAGTSYTFPNTSVNASSYEWYVNGVLKSTATTFVYTFPSVGSFTVKLIAKSGNTLCDDGIKSTDVNVVCGVVASFSKSASLQPAGTNINFTNSSAGANSYEWYVNDVLQTTTTNFSYTSSAAGTYIIKLIAKNTTVSCQQEFTDTVRFTCSVTADFVPLVNTTIINTPVTFTSTGTGATTYQWKINGAAVGTGPALSYTFTSTGVYSIQLVAGNGVCSDTKYGLLYVTDKCGNGQYLFQNSYAAGLVSGANDTRATADGGVVLAGRVVPAGSLTNYYGIVLKLDAGGNVQWMNSYTTGNNSYFEKIKPASDGGYIVIGYTTAGLNTSGKIFIVKLAAAGTIQWSREFAATDMPASRGTDILESTDGNYYFTGYTLATGTSNLYDVVAGKIDMSGNLNWLNIYDARLSEKALALSEDRTQLVICGNATGETKDGFVLNIAKADGGFSWAKRYQSGDENFNGIATATDGYVINATRSAAAGGLFTDHVYLRTDFSGKPFYSNYIQPFGTGKAIGWAANVSRPNGNMVSLTACEFGGTYFDFVLQEVDPAKGVLWTKKYNRADVWMSSLDRSPDEGIFLGGASSEISASPLQTNVMRLDAKGDAGACPAENIRLQLVPLSYNLYDADFTATAAQTQVSNSSNLADIAVTVNKICGFVQCDSVPLPVDSCAADSCNFLKITGADSVCSIKNTVTYQVQKNASCTALPNWIIDTSFAKIILQTDSSVTIRFLKTGSTDVVASIKQVCKTIADTITVNVQQTKDSVNLGPDMQLCSFSTIKLSAGSGFKSYHWNDGSVDSVLTAYNPGQYAVTAEDYCGNKYSDTINIYVAPVIPFDLGADLKKCNGDTIVVKAPGSFLKYTWSPAYNINTTNGSTVKLWPAADTTYIVIAEVAKGCTVVDSIRIKVNKSVKPFIGNDTSFCSGGAAVFKAPNGFINCTWQDGSANQSFTATAKGMYYATVTDSNGCVAGDTAFVNNVYPLPVVSLGSDISICQNEVHRFDVGSGFVKYLWQDNSTTQTFSTGLMGTYWVQVTDTHACKTSDTVLITAVKPVPANFLDAFAALCSGRSITVTANGSWQSYLWSTSATTPAIEITQAGRYWLQVTGANGCSASDTITVAAENCVNSIYFANAFTPNNDGHNDIYKPLITGVLLNIQFNIYDRYGNKVFDTTDPAKGWDGSYKGKPQGNNTYVWYCTYQFEGASARSKKGTVLLIR